MKAAPRQPPGARTVTNPALEREVSQITEVLRIIHRRATRLHDHAGTDHAKAGEFISALNTAIEAAETLEWTLARQA